MHEGRVGNAICCTRKLGGLKLASRARGVKVASLARRDGGDDDDVNFGTYWWGEGGHFGI